MTSALVDEATAFLCGFKNTLIKTYRQDARNHFTDAKSEKNGPISHESETTQCTMATGMKK